MSIVVEKCENDERYNFEVKIERKITLPLYYSANIKINAKGVTKEEAKSNAKSLLNQVICDMKDYHNMIDLK